MKRAFVASGGGSRGNYHVGVLDYLLGVRETHYDIFAGVSVGALVCAFLAQYREGDERRAATELQELFLPITTSDIYKAYSPFGKLHALWEPSLFDSSPLEELVCRALDVDRVLASGKELRVGAFNLDTGNYELFDQHTSPLFEAVLASASYPVAFRPITRGSHRYSDGGIRTVTPIKAAIDAGADVIDVSICHSLKPDKPAFAKSPNALDVGLAALDGMGEEILLKDVRVAQLYTQLCAARSVPGKRPVEINLIAPSEALRVDSLTFDPQEAQRLSERGFQDALEVFRRSP
jgi:predicted acylesterase/phospholipase RssA